MLIPKPAQSAYENADTDIREMLDRMIAELQATPSWEQRSTQFLEIIDALELAFEGDEDADEEYDGEAEGLDAADLDDDDLDEDDELDGDEFDDEDDEYVESQAAADGKVNGWHADDVVPADDGDDDDAVVVEEFADVLPFYVGAVLERLGETKIERPEQAAFYLLSCHPEHTEAAQSWLEKGANMKRFQKFVDDTPDYEAILEMMDERYGEEDDDEDEDE
ncbi:hypothetical protein JL100_024915 [Skermanella mucosa]|uniref:hypothetical protein n=1 Tax=Skermanella mucosa TaxID=1789672 RepID=UPI00192BD6BD|nr:hypothetical protein [Skermanella mucosa]UEM20284.1 hypothetical protein JL100_024915 [Skermanella mucosa]